MIDIFERLSITVGAIPSDVLREAEDLRAKLPQSFEEILRGAHRARGRQIHSGWFLNRPARVSSFKNSTSLSNFAKSIRRCLLDRHRAARTWDTRVYSVNVLYSLPS